MDIKAHELRPGDEVRGPFGKRKVQGVTVQPRSLINGTFMGDDFKDELLLSEKEYEELKGLGLIDSALTPRWGPGVLVWYEGREKPVQYKLHAEMEITYRS